MKEPIAELSGVRLAYQEQSSETLAVNDLSFSVQEGEFVSIVGPSGCGKTTVLSMLMGLLEPSSGSVRLLGQKPGDRTQVCYMLQRDHLLDWRTVEENVLLSLEVKRILTPERRAQWLQSTPLGRFGDTADIAELAVFLASDKGGYITGAKINVNGGLSTG